MFFLFDSLLANKGTWCVTFQNNQKNKCDFSDFIRDFLIIFLQNRSYPDVELYGWQKNKRKNMFLTDKIARKSCCVGGLFYAIQVELVHTQYYLV